MTSVYWDGALTHWASLPGPLAHFLDAVVWRAVPKLGWASRTQQSMLKIPTLGAVARDSGLIHSVDLNLGTDIIESYVVY